MAANAGGHDAYWWSRPRSTLLARDQQTAATVTGRESSLHGLSTIFRGLVPMLVGHRFFTFRKGCLKIPVREAVAAHMLKRVSEASTSEASDTRR